MQCSVDGCEKEEYRQGMCNAHRMRLRTYGRLHLINNVGSGYSIDHRGYVSIVVNGKRIYEHVYRAQQALGKPLPKGAEIHHMNKKPWDNDTPFNLIICPDRTYHRLLHKRAKELGYEGY